MSAASDFAQRQALALATKIAQSIEYLLSEERHISVPQKVFFVLRAAMHVFTCMDEWQEVEWCRAIFEELDRQG